MARTIAEADWKVLRRLHPLALERFCERVLAEIEQVTQNLTQSAHQRYIDIFKIVEQRDRDIARLFNDPKRSHALTMLTGIRSEGTAKREIWRRYLGVQASMLSDSVLSFNTIHDRIKRCETGGLRDRTWLGDELAAQAELDIESPGFAKDLWHAAQQSFPWIRRWEHANSVRTTS